ncbi:MAG: acyl-CoA dehydrogenase family protein [Oscillospiraceae bacterium]
MFLLTEEQIRLKKEIRTFVDREIKPRAMELDRSGEYPRDLVRRVGELGYCALPFSPEFGGNGLGALEGLIFIEEISRGLASLGLIFCAHMFQCCYALADGISERQSRDWFKPSIACDKLLAFALSENSGGSDALGIDTIATRTHEGWSLSGSKVWITNASVADGYIVGARTTVNSRNRDVSLFYVDANSPGLEASEREKLIGLNNSPTGCVRFNNCTIPADAIIGNENDGYKLIKNALNCGRLALAAVAIGIAQDAMELALKFSGERGNFGRAIASYQGVSFPIAEMYTNISLARNMLYHAADLAGSGGRSTMEIAALKLFSTEMCQEVCRQSVLIHGGRGYSKDYDAERLLRDSQLLTTAEGTSQICKIVISNGLFNSSPEQYQ